MKTIYTPANILHIMMLLMLFNMFFIESVTSQSTIKEMITPPIVEKDRKPVQFFHDYPAVLAGFSVNQGQGNTVVTWHTLYEEGMRTFLVQYSEDGISWQPAGEVTPLNNPAGTKYSFNHILTNPDRMVFYRLLAVNKDGRMAYSPVKKMMVTTQAGNYIFPTIINRQQINLYLNEPFESIQVVNMQGNILLRQFISGKTGRIDISLPAAAATGAYIVRVQHKDSRKTIVKRVIVE